MRASSLQVIDLIDGLIVRHIWIPVLFLSFPLIYSLPDGRQPRRRRVPQRPNGREFTCQCTYLPPTSRTIVFWLRHRSPCPDPDFPQKVSGRTSYEPTSASPHCLVICDGCHTEMTFDDSCSVSGESTSHSRCIRFSWHTIMPAHTSRTTGLLDQFHSLHSMQRQLRTRLPPDVCSPAIVPRQLTVTSHTIVAGQSPATRCRHTPRIAHTQRSRGSSASLMPAQRCSRRRACACVLC